MAESGMNSTAEQRVSHVNDACTASARDAEACAVAPGTFELPAIEIPAAFRELADTIAALANAELDLADATETAVAITERVVAGAARDEGLDDDSENLDDDGDVDLDDAEANEENVAPNEEAAASDGDLATAAATATAYSLKIVEAACFNASAVIACAGDLLRATSLSQMVELSTAHAARQIEAVAEQTKQLAAVTQIINRKKSNGNGEPDDGPQDSHSSS